MKKDPNTGVEYGVPFATVYAEDTICSLLGLFPANLPWSWFFPFFCHTEVIAQTTTDACGNFCVWVPRLEIEWILRWRLERICYVEIFPKADGWQRFKVFARTAHQTRSRSWPRGPGHVEARYGAVRESRGGAG